ncbi:MAG: HAMP domain-containing histidine kinase, partial [Acidimicrobiia bacterium]|nr:HAMP domain-containing histidine kinase [Acidimicrobiia bacterium]
MIRRRLTALVVLLLVAVLGVFSAAVLVVTRGAVQAELERDVTNRSNALAAALIREPDALADDYVSRFGATDVVAVVFSDTGAVVARSASLPERELVFVPELFTSGRAEEIDQGGALVVRAQTVDLPSGQQVYVLVGRSPDRTYEALRTLAEVLVPAGLVALVGAAIGVHLLVRPALRPLEQLDAEAARIATTADHGGRIQGRYGNDEVGALAESVDSMLVSLGEAHRLAQNNADRLRHFLADVSHELRAPLALVTSSIDVLERTDPGTDEHDRLLADVRAEVCRMARIVTQLLLMARGEDARVADRPLLLFDLVAATGRRWRGGTDLAVDLAGLGPVRDVVINGNEDQLTQLFDVLLDNALRYTPAGGRVDLAGGVDEDRAWVSVTDTGVG